MHTYNSVLHAKGLSIFIMEKSNVLLIINPVAGRKKAKTMLFEIIDALCRQGYKTTTFTTTRPGDATDIAAKHAKDFDKVVCCGGDGTLNEVLTGLAKSGVTIPLGYVPTGTTNDLAASLNLPSQIDKALSVMENNIIQGHDVGRFNESQFFTYVATFGALVNVAYSTPQWLKNRFGRAAYVMKGATCLSSFKPRKIHVVADGKEYDGEFIFGSVSSSTVIGGIVKLPIDEVAFDDGLFELFLARKPTCAKDIQKIATSVITKKFDEDVICYTKAKNLSFKFEESVEWSTDGEFAGAHEMVEIENIPRALQLIVNE